MRGHRQMQPATHVVRCARGTDRGVGARAAFAYNPIFVANIRSSQKDMRRTARRTLRNRAVRSAVKTRITKFRRAVDAGDTGEDAQELAGEAIASLDRAASKGILHPNNAARRKSRLLKRLRQASESS